MAEEALHDLMPNYNSGNYVAKFILIPQNLYFNSHCYLILEQEADILRWMEEEIALVSGHATQNLGMEPVLASTCTLVIFAFFFSFTSMEINLFPKFTNFLFIKVC